MVTWSPRTHSTNLNGPEPTTRAGSVPVDPGADAHSANGTDSQMCFGMMPTAATLFSSISAIGSLPTSSNVLSSIARYDCVTCTTSARIGLSVSSENTASKENKQSC